MHTYFTACYAFLVKLVVQEKNFAPHVTFTDYCVMLSCLAFNLYTYTRLITKFNIFVMNNRKTWFLFLFVALVWLLPVCVLNSFSKYLLSLVVSVASWQSVENGSLV